MPQLSVALALDVVANGIARSRDGRLFLVLPRGNGLDSPCAVEWIAGRLVPFPDVAWNSWSAGADATQRFVQANALRIGPNGDLWIVDNGSPGIGDDSLPGGPKLVHVDLATNQVRRIYYLDCATREKSFIDDFRFNGSRVYLTDAGAAGLIVLNLASGDARRVLDNHPSLIAQRPMSAEGQTLIAPNGEPIFIHADQLEVSPDGQWLYYQPCSGPLSRIATRWLDDGAIDDAMRAQHVEAWADTGSTGGTAIDAAGNLYVSDTDELLIRKIAPDGTMTTVIQDRRLLWPDAMWIDDRQMLWIPAAQLNRMAQFQCGISRVAFPVCVYSLPIGIGPAANDHD